jgi:hypothetical protein
MNVNNRSAAQGNLDHVAFVADEGQWNLLKILHIKHFKCYHGKEGEKNEEQTLAEATFTALQVMLTNTRVEIGPMLILSDNESTVDIFKHKDILTDIRKTKKLVHLKGNPIKINEES